jgi:hypothetical protein
VELQVISVSVHNSEEQSYARVVFRPIGSTGEAITSVADLEINVGDPQQFYLYKVGDTYKVRNLVTATVPPRA